ncbi:MAG: hypothetical protein R2838_25035 [Caldilineaceae bacterium]
MRGEIAGAMTSAQILSSTLPRTVACLLAVPALRDTLMLIDYGPSRACTPRAGALTVRIEVRGQRAAAHAILRDARALGISTLDACDVAHIYFWRPTPVQAVAPTLRVLAGRPGG